MEFDVLQHATRLPWQQNGQRTLANIPCEAKSCIILFLQ